MWSRPIFSLMRRVATISASATFYTCTLKVYADARVSGSLR